MASRHGYSTATHSAGSVSSTSGTVIAANASRRYLLVANNGPNGCFIHLGGAATVNDIPLPTTGSNYEMNPGHGDIFTGHIQAITSAGTTLLSVLEGT